MPKAGGERSAGQTGEPMHCEMSPDLRALGEAWGLFADRLFANPGHAGAAEKAKADRRPLNPEQRNSDHDVSPSL
jgi:hypothetical protein